MKHYGVHSQAEELIVPQVVMIDGSRIVVVMEKFSQHKESTDQAVHGQRMREEDVFRVKVWALYDMEDRKMRPSPATCTRGNCWVKWMLVHASKKVKPEVMAVFHRDGVGNSQVTVF